MLKLIKDFKEFLDLKKELSELVALREKFKKGREILNLINKLQEIEIKMQSQFAAFDKNYARKVSEQRQLETTLEKMLKEYN